MGHVTAHAFGSQAKKGFWLWVRAGLIDCLALHGQLHFNAVSLTIACCPESSPKMSQFKFEANQILVPADYFCTIELVNLFLQDEQNDKVKFKFKDTQ